MLQDVLKRKPERPRSAAVVRCAARECAEQGGKQRADGQSFEADNRHRERTSHWPIKKEAGPVRRMGNMTSSKMTMISANTKGQPPRMTSMMLTFEMAATTFSTV